MERRDVSEAFIINEKEEVLLQKKTLDYLTVPGGCWTFFGGQIKKYENPENALKREVREELGYVVDSCNLFKTDDYELESGKYGKRYIYIVPFKGSLSKLSLSEGGGFALFDKSELENIKIDKFCKKTLEEYFEINIA